MITPREVRVVAREWGTEVWLVNLDYCGKMLKFPTAHLGTSMHYHQSKSESFVVLAGSLMIEFEDQPPVLLSDCEPLVIDVPAGTRHRLTPLQDCTVICEFSSHHEDADSFRVGERRRPARSTKT